MSEVDWDDVHGCDGTSAHVPGLLGALAGPEPAARAYAELFNHVCHQGTRWQVSAVVVPFLVALVDEPATPNRAGLMRMLAAVAIGDHRDNRLPFDADAAYPEAESITDEQLRLLTRWLDGHEDREEDPVEAFYWDRSGADRWARDAYRALAAHATTVARWVRDPDPAVAARAAALLAWFPTTPHSRAALLTAPDGPARASANLALAHLPRDDPDIDRRLEELLSAPDAQVALTAAIAVAYRHGAATKEPALTMLAVAADHDRPLPDDVPGWDRRALRGFVAIALTRIGW